MMLFFLFLAIPVFSIWAQTQTTYQDPGYFDLGGSPQWVKDLRRWEIVAFGSIPFTMFLTTFSIDMYRWQQANGMDFSSEGRRYAPWPIKSAGAFAMESHEVVRTLTIAAALSVTVAFADLIIVQVKRRRARKRIEAMPSSTVIIEQRPLLEETTGGQGGDPPLANDLLLQP
jgi:hypothetical protein